MVNKKTNKYYRRTFHQKKGDLYKPSDAARKKYWKRKKKISRAKKIQSVQEERNCPCQGMPLKKRMSEQLQISNATSISETIATFSNVLSIFNSIKQTFSQSVNKTKRSLPSFPWKKVEVVGTLAKKFNLRIAVHNKWGIK